ncbi:MAG: hypothetical protein GX330_06430 [Bacteroidales bacterium]|nr:hypothetical protein [Bacteroidales bacterium]
MKRASAADNDYLKETITNIHENVNINTIAKVYADEAYQSRDNRGFADENSIELITSGLQGKQSKYDPEMKEGEPVVTHMETEEIIPAYKTEDKWRIAAKGKSKYRYFTDEQIATAELRRKPAVFSKEEQNKKTTWRQPSFSIVFIQGSTKHDIEA